MSEVVVYDTSVKVKKADITDEHTTAIVNLNNSTLNQNFGIAKVILDAAGDSVKAECALLGTIPSDGCVVTRAGKLKCKNIIHLANVTPPIIVDSVKKALKTCEGYKFTTVSLPAFGTGAAHLDPQSSIKLIFRGIEEHLLDVKTSTIISEITIVVNKDDVYQEYLNFFQNCQTNYSCFTAFGKTIELKKGDITDQPVDCILNLTNETLDQACGVSKDILTAAGTTVKEECKKIGFLKNGDVAMTSGGTLKSKKIMHIIGPIRVPEYEPSIDKILLECHNHGITSLAIPAIGTGIAQVRAKASIKAILSSILKYLSGTLIPSLQTICIVVMKEDIYKTYLEIFLEKSTEVQETKRDEAILSALQKEVIIEYPKTWTSMGNEELMVIPLKKESSEYQNVITNLSTTKLGSYTIDKIERIQNLKLFQSYSIKKQAVDRQNPRKQNVHHLYHGTSVDAIVNINHGGFNRAYCGKNATVYGLGTYFAVKSDYSCTDIYSRPDSDGKKYIYQAAVVTGRYCEGKSTYKEPPYIDGNPNGDRYDSAVDNVANPDMFVVFHDDYAYPEYLITLKPRITSSCCVS